jgi:glycine/D-amino acid oxidase-like deaminating enzyme
MTASDSRPDVAIIGGGIVGAATAALIAEAGARVRLYEATEIAAAASGRNSGVIQHPFDSVLVGLYRESLALYRALAVEVAAFGLPVEPAGLLLVGFDRAIAEAEAAVWQGAYPDTRATVLAGATLIDQEPGLAPDVVACRLEIGFPVAPAAATHAFAALARDRGAEVLIGRRAELAIRDGAAIGVEVDGRIKAADAVVIAAGPWTPSLIDPTGRWQPIRPVWGVVAQVGLDRPPRHVLEETAIDIEPSEPGAQSADDAAGAFGFSLVTADGASALGSAFLDTEPDPPALVARLRERGARYVPALATAPVAGARSCARPVSADRRPLVGRVPGLAGAFVAAGHGPWGISTGPATARMVADLVLGREPVIPPQLDPARFGTV